MKKDGVCMDKDTTRNLSRRLEKIKEDKEADEFVKNHSRREPMDFHQYINEQIGKKDVAMPVVCQRSGISRNYFYNIINGHTLRPGRDKVIALCIGVGMTYSEVQRGLELAGLAPLYPKDERDVRIAVAINKGAKDVSDINFLLDEYGLKTLEI